ncbi:hypothetical protein COCON_G00070700 [Conger conger]|uniref:protein-glutamine gamma-glutamyltransferase n=1 Tax=Conger conger TaxID=82655 RepID=A0A9Q1DTQ7_CONCO|nr:hypothetical protein COCON_G00070700 [Conger conger]
MSSHFKAIVIDGRVNSDKIFWQRKIDGTFEQIHMERKAVGHCISTKAVGSEKRQDITPLQIPGGHGGGAHRRGDRVPLRLEARDLHAGGGGRRVRGGDHGREGPRMGGDAQLTIVLRNSSAEPRSTTLHSQVAVMYYTGVHKATVKKDQTPIELLPNEVKSLDWVLEYKHYQNQLVDQAALMLTLSGRVKETQQVLATQYNFRLRTPDLSIAPVGDAVVGKEMAAKISFTNPLPRTLKRVLFRVEGLGLQSVREITIGDVGSHSTVTVTEHFVPLLPGRRKLVASLDCRQLTQVHGVADIVVREN